MPGPIEHYRARALTLAPGAEDGISYGVPALRYRGRPLVGVVATTAGFSLYPFSSAVVAQVAVPAGLSTTKGAVRFTAEHPVPDEVFDAIVVARRAEIDAALARPARSGGQARP
jgi:uncharacterized protein YdhG (YjbR/CyaY superfamily)